MRLLKAHEPVNQFIVGAIMVRALTLSEETQLVIRDSYSRISHMTTQIRLLDRTWKVRNNFEAN